VFKSRLNDRLGKDRYLGALRGSTTLVGTLRQLCAHLVVALVALVGIGGATRVMEAGLACPDWPLCYGSLFPGNLFSLQVFLEWFHRLDAFVVGVALVVLTAISFARRDRLPPWLPVAAVVALVLVALQGGLGALTVLQLLPAGIVTAHLGTALALVALLSGLHQALADRTPAAESAPLPSWWPALAATSTALVLAQCLLGGAMASQWAAGLCLTSGDACGWLLVHRQLAGAAGLVVVGLALVTAWLPSGPRRPLGLAASAAALVALQILLGILSLRLTLSVPLVTVAHQLTAAVLVAVLAALTVRGFLDDAILETSRG
jgi:cytochrome c oxidase assembly protein subunit 15